MLEAHDIGEMSICKGEGEWLLPPGGKFVVDSIGEDSEKDPGAVPHATQRKRVRMRQVLG